MYITEVILDGFKSYGQRTEVLNFDRQFTAITGLNGSGKSNILDAICFVLGITNLSHVRAANLQELIYKSGQGGVNKATVTITFNNTDPDQCPPGFENYREISVARQVIMGGKTKYLINGCIVTNKKIQDLFLSVKLNVNNPHFMVMQGKITKVLNMKPQEILAMLEEAAGTRLYESKKQTVLKIIEKKNSKLQELTAIITDEIEPKLTKLRQERAQYLEYQVIVKELEYSLQIYKSWQYHLSKISTEKSEKALDDAKSKITHFEEQINKNKRIVSELEEKINKMSEQLNINEELQALEAQLKEKQAIEAKSKAANKGCADEISSTENQRKLLEKNLADDIATLASKEQQLNQTQSMFTQLQKKCEDDKRALEIAQKKYEALVSGFEVNDEGQTQTLQEQLISVKKELAEATTEHKQTEMQLKFCRIELQKREKELGTDVTDYQKDKIDLDRATKEVQTLEKEMGKLNFSEEKMNDYLNKRRQMNRDANVHREKIDQFEARRPYTQFKYRDPETNFDRRKVHGKICRLIEIPDSKNYFALEIAAGSRLYEVAVEDEATAKKLLQRGNLQQRTTFIPLNKIQARKIDQNTIRVAKDLVGKENVQPALSLIKYNDRRLDPAMEYVFGNAFICKDMNVAKTVAFHPQIKKRCVTLEGDVIDPAGTMSGGSRPKEGSTLLLVKEIQQIEDELKEMERNFETTEREMGKMSSVQDKYAQLKRQIELKSHDVQLIQNRLQQTEYHRLQEEIEHFKKQIVDLTQKQKDCSVTEEKCNGKLKDLEHKMKDSKGYKDQQLKKAEVDFKNAKEKSEKSQKEWSKHEGDYETLTLEISEIKKTIEASQEKSKQIIESIEKFKENEKDSAKNLNEIKSIVKELSDRIKAEKAIISSKNYEINETNKQKSKLLEENNDFLLKIQEVNHDVKQFEDEYRNNKAREENLAAKIEKNKHSDEGANLGEKEGKALERRIKDMQERTNKLKRVVNTEAQAMYEHEEKQCEAVRKKRNVVENDKKKLLITIKELDERKKETLKLAFNQVSKDFGSIFKTLLPGANAKLAAPMGKTILEGVEIKVALGNIWKESLVELSGGQRSLAALSFILAMLLFKPAPFYILDEVDAALDLSHTQNIGQMLKAHFKKSQFIIVSLKDGMFNNANVLFRTKFVDGMSTVTRTTSRV